ncbi:MAG: hypothetical protein JHC26_08625 [Thermofilum sp.]|jgi:hypothetical protein|uniref:hypothetical protein n=1 Tax=Thermofilum sp. TaxID=1961369 RepID=UPI0025884DE9|nr:hypothetical protein [Thermofilum sp.]MCI4409141.1 hypothetical protein [Thermofilum sp.]
MRLRKRDKLQEAIKELEASGYKVKDVKKVKRGHKVTASTQKILRSGDVEELARKFAQHGYVLERPVHEVWPEGTLHIFVHKKKRFGIF